jgi:glycosyltransferase involved in cell wall biosynthesis
MASGLPVVAFNGAAAGQLITHRVDGLLAPITDPAAFCQLACDIACDGGLRLRLGAQAGHKALELGWTPILQRIEDVYAATTLKASTAALPQVWTKVQQI